MEINIAVYTNSNNCSIINTLIEYFKKQFSIVNIHLFNDSDSICDNTKIACLPSFYMPFYSETIIFLNIEDFIENHKDLISNKIYVITSINDIKLYHLDKKTIDSIRVLKLENEKIYEI